MRRLICLTLLLTATVLATPLDAATDPAGHDIVILEHEETVRVDDAGRVIQRIRTVRQLNTQWAIRGHSDVRVAWDSARQDLEVVTARTVMVDGTEVPTPENGFNEVTPGAVSRAGDFLHWREMVISHVGTEPGCTVELEYVLRDREPGPLPASGIAWLGDAFPVIQSTVRIEGAATALVGLDADC